MICYAPSVGQPRKCIVSFRDGEGVERVAEVTAESLYEAGALALQQFRRADWSRNQVRYQAALRPDRGISVLSPLSLTSYAALTISTSSLKLGAIGAIEGGNSNPMRFVLPLACETRCLL